MNPEGNLSRIQMALRKQNSDFVQEILNRLFVTGFGLLPQLGVISLPCLDLFDSRRKVSEAR